MKGAGWADMDGDGENGSARGKVRGSRRFDHEVLLILATQLGVGNPEHCNAVAHRVGGDGLGPNVEAE